MWLRSGLVGKNPPLLEEMGVFSFTKFSLDLETWDEHLSNMPGVVNLGPLVAFAFISKPPRLTPKRMLLLSSL